MPDMPDPSDPREEETQDGRPPTVRQSAAMQKALRLVRAGRSVEAEELMLEEARRVAGQHPQGSQPYAAAQNELASVLLSAGHIDRALDALREACAGPEATDSEAQRERLTALMNLGEVLEHAGRLDEAEAVLRRGLDGRRAYYGRDHAGYAFGLEPLAAVLLRQGKPGVALEMIEETVRIFWANQHPRVAGALALRAEVLKAAGKDTPPFDGLDELPDAIIGQIADGVIQRVGRTDLELSSAVLADLLPLVSDRLGEGHAATLDVLMAISNVERMLGDEGDASARQSAIRKALAVYDRTGRPREAVQGVLGLAVARSDAGDTEGADASYRDAADRAGRLKDPALGAQVGRNWGLLLAEQGRRDEAEAQLRAAVDHARRSRDPELIGRCLIALGIFLQHGHRLDEAKSLLAEAMSIMDPAHPDAICGRGHLGAIESGASCGCGDTGQAMADAFREFVLARLPEGLMERLDVELKNGDFRIGVHLSREPAEEELNQLNRVISHALEEFRRKILSRS